MSRLAPRLTFLTLALCLLAGCAAKEAAPELSRIPDQAWGQVLAFDGDFNEACFSDDYLDINLTAANEDLDIFELDLLNKTGAPVLVHWEQLVFLDASGNRQYMIHQGVIYGQPLEALQPTSLESQGALREQLRPARLQLEKGLARLAPLRGQQDRAAWSDQRLRIDLPIEIYGRVHIYRFRFHVELGVEDDILRKDDPPK